MRKAAFLTTIFPMQKAYLYVFFESLNKQSYKDFDLIVLNDGYEELEEFVLIFSDLNIIELSCSGTPAENRALGIEYVKNNHYDFLIFGDSDDCFDGNRVECSIEMLKNSDIVVNDLSLFDEKHGVYKEKYISSRVKNGATIELDFIKDKNIFGMTNTAVKVTVLNDIEFDDNLVAVDWYLFSVLLLSGCKAVFTDDTVTYYRQFESNVVGLKKSTKKSILKSVDVKLMHYKLMKNKSSSYAALYDDICIIKNNLNDAGFFNKMLKADANNLFWWEEVRRIE